MNFNVINFKEFLRLIVINGIRDFKFTRCSKHQFSLVVILQGQSNLQCLSLPKTEAARRRNLRGLLVAMKISTTHQKT